MTESDHSRPLRMPGPAPVEDPRRNLPLLVALVLAGLEAVALLAAAVWSLVTIRGSADPIVVSIGLAVVLVLFALLLLAGINALWNGRRWGRGPVLTWQLIQLAGSLGLLGQMSGAILSIVIVVSVVVCVGLLLPRSIDATSRSSGSTA